MLSYVKYYGGGNFYLPLEIIFNNLFLLPRLLHFYNITKKQFTLTFNLSCITILKKRESSLSR